MELYGWDVDAVTDLGSYEGACSNSTFAGGMGTSAKGVVSTFCHGYGTATLDLGQCGVLSASYKIEALLNGTQIALVQNNQNSIVKSFYYKPKDELLVKSNSPYSFMIINSLQVFCEGINFDLFVI